MKVNFKKIEETPQPDAGFNDIWDYWTMRYVSKEKAILAAERLHINHALIRHIMKIMLKEIEIDPKFQTFVEVMKALDENMESDMSLVSLHVSNPHIKYESPI